MAQEQWRNRIVGYADVEPEQLLAHESKNMMITAKSGIIRVVKKSPGGATNTPGAVNLYERMTSEDSTPSETMPKMRRDKASRSVQSCQGLPRRAHERMFGVLQRSKQSACSGISTSTRSAGKSLRMADDFRTEGIPRSETQGIEARSNQRIWRMLSLLRRIVVGIPDNRSHLQRWVRASWPIWSIPGGEYLPTTQASRISNGSLSSALLQLQRCQATRSGRPSSRPRTGRGD